MKACWDGERGQGKAQYYLYVLFNVTFVRAQAQLFDLLTLSDLGHKGLFTVNRVHVRILLARKCMLLAAPLSSWGSFWGWAS